MYVTVAPALRPTELMGARAPAQELPFPLSSARIAAFYAARYALYRLLEALGIGSGDAVLVPAYHHGNEVRAVRATGAAVRFFAIDGGFAPRLDEIARSARPPVRALLAIHTIGWPQPIEALAELCRRRGIVLIEDCAHAFLGTHAGRPLGSFGDYAIFCLYKTVPVPNGGLLVQNREDAAALPVRPQRQPDGISAAASLAELLLHGVRLRHEALGRALLGLKRAAGQTLTAARVRRIPVGDAGFDIGASSTGMSSFCHRMLRRFRYDTVRHRRRANYEQLRRRLAGRAALLGGELAEGTCPLFFPLLVSDKAAAAQLLEARGVETVEFWNAGDPAAEGAFPTAAFLRAHVLELPIHQDLAPDHIDFVADAVLSLGPILELGRTSRPVLAEATLLRRAMAAALGGPDDPGLAGSA